MIAEPSTDRELIHRGPARSRSFRPGPAWTSGPRAVTLALCLSLLAACGGGGAGGGPGPTTGGSASDPVPASATKTLAVSEDEARALAGAVLGADGDLASANESFKRVNNGGLSLVAPTAAGSGGLAAGPALKTVLGTVSGIAKGVNSVACSDVYPVGDAFEGNDDLITGCTGSITLVTPEGVSPGGDSLPTGTRLTISYTNLTVTATRTGLFSLNGTVSLVVTETLVTSGGSVTGGLRIEAENLSGIEGGESFGPENFTLEMTFSQGGVSLLIDGERISNLQTEFTDDQNFTVSGGSAVTGVGTDGYVGISFGSWQVIGGIPQPGSSLTITGAGGGTATLLVTAADAGTATFSVQIDAAGASGTYVVVASFVGDQVTIL